MNVYWVAFVWISMALVASLISIRLGISVALVEILVGAIVGNLPHASEWVQQTEFTTFLASVGSLMLTFLAGAEIDPVSLRRHWKASVSIGFVSFLLPFVGALAFSYYVLGWTLEAAEIAGIALSTTSVAVVYAVMVETGLNRQELGKLILAACFVTDLGTVLALRGVVRGRGYPPPRIHPGECGRARPPAEDDPIRDTPSGPPRERTGDQVPAPGSVRPRSARRGGGSEAVLPAYVSGLVIAGIFLHDRVLIDRMRTICFALLTPFFFLRAGLLISGPALVSGAGVIAALLAVKLVTKAIGVWPTARAFRVPPRERTYLTLLMSTGLTFGSIAALFGLTHHLITQQQYSELVTVVILSALVPTIVAQQFFRPALIDEEEEEALGAEDATTIRRQTR